MATDSNRFQAIISHCKEYGFIFPSSEIYDGLSAVYDYGQWGAELKRNIRDYWWKWMTQFQENIVGIDAAIFMHPTTWKASGHVDNFSDPMIDNRDSNKRYRVDHLIEAYAENLQKKAYDETALIGGGQMDPFSGGAEFILNSGIAIQSHPDWIEADNTIKQMEQLLGANDYEGLRNLIIEKKISCPISGTVNWTEIRQFNLMFSTQLGSVSEEASEIYLRPETAQGIFVNFLNVQKTGRMKIPFGIAQVGKAFRNEIVARQFVFRMREFEQMEMQFFIRPGTQKEWYEFWKAERMKWHLGLGIPKSKYRFHDHVKLAHYADAACDIEYDFPIGFKEVEGIHSRTDFDLRSHQEFSHKKIQYHDPELNQSYIPYVIETSIGLDRTIFMVLSEAYQEEDLSTSEKKDSRAVLKLPAALAPVKLAILPLTKKDGLPEIGKEIMVNCRMNFRCFYEEKDTIGKRYRRMDAIGTPFCVTIDHQTKEDGTVTLRDRDTMAQERIPIEAISEIIKNKVSNSLKY